MDSFICGSCLAVFHDIGEFLEHKKVCATVSVEEASGTVVTNQQPTSVQATVVDADGKSTTFIIINGDMEQEANAPVSTDVCQLVQSFTCLGQSAELTESGVMFF